MSVEHNSPVGKGPHFIGCVMVWTSSMRLVVYFKFVPLGGGMRLSVVHRSFITFYYCHGGSFKPKQNNIAALQLSPHIQIYVTLFMFLAVSILHHYIHTFLKGKFQTFIQIQIHWYFGVWFTPFSLPRPPFSPIHSITVSFP